MDQDLNRRGFLTPNDPATSFPSNSAFAVLDEFGRDLPSLLYRDDFRGFARGLSIPPLPEKFIDQGVDPAYAALRVRMHAMPRTNRKDSEVL